MQDEAFKNKAITFATAVASGHGIRHAAKLADISERTAYRWLKKESIQRRIKILHDHATSRAKAMLTTAKVAAARTLVKAARSGDVRAAKTILVDLVGMSDSAEIAELREMIEKLTGRNPSA
jgi:transposase